MLGLDRRICNSPDADGKLKEPLITPDYSSRLEDIYLLTARRLLIREGNLHLLSFVQHDTEVGAGSLPSWVPQWHINKHRLITQFDLLSGHPVKVAQEATWAKKTVSSKHLTDGLWNSEKPLDVIDDGTLRAQGLLLTTVSEKCADVAFTTDCGSGWIQALRQWLQRVLIWSENNAQQDGRDVSQLQLHDIVFRVFYRVLFGGHLRIKDVFNQLRREINVFRDLLYSVSAEAANLCPTTRRLVIQMCRSRTLFLTIEGQVGIGPQCLQPGDSVCLLSGAAVPLLMRQDPGALARWLLVGETYVNGLAHVSNDYEAAEDFEALHNGAALDELRSSLANSGIRIQSDPTRLPRSCGMSKSYLWSNEFDPLEELSGEIPQQASVCIAGLTIASQSKKSRRSMSNLQRPALELASWRWRRLTLASPSSSSSIDEQLSHVLSAEQPLLYLFRCLPGFKSSSTPDQPVYKQSPMRMPSC